MRRGVRLAGTLLILAGLGLLAWGFTIWRWQDPFTAVYTHLEQRELEQSYERREAAFAPPDATPTTSPVDPEELEQQIAAAARRYRDALKSGDPVGRLQIPRLGLTIMIVEGTETEPLKRGPGRFSELLVPGEGGLVYVAGHRTTYSAPFSRIDTLRPGDAVFVDVPYGRFEYRVTGHRIVRADDVSVLRSRDEEVLALQACHPRFFASHRYIAYAKPVSVTPPRGTATAIGR
jgi:sortase A